VSSGRSAHNARTDATPSTTGPVAARAGARQRKRSGAGRPGGSDAQEKLIKAGYTSIINGGPYDELHDELHNALYDVTDDPAE
jgi:hypothetical protein